MIVHNEVHRPSFVCLLWHWQYHSRPGGSLPAPFPPQRQTFFAVYPLCSLMINHQAFPFQHDVQPGTTKPFPLLRQIPQAVTQGVIIIRLRPVPVDR